MLFKTLFFFFLEILKKVGTAKPKMALLHCTASAQSLLSLCTEGKFAFAKFALQNAATPPGHGEGTTCMCQGTGADCTQSIDLK